MKVYNVYNFRWQYTISYRQNSLHKAQKLMQE